MHILLDGGNREVCRGSRRACMRHAVPALGYWLLYRRRSWGIQVVKSALTAGQVKVPAVGPRGYPIDPVTGLEDDGGIDCAI